MKNVQESSQHTCCVCFGLYKDDINSGTGLFLDGCDWIQSTNKDCAAWSYVNLSGGTTGWLCVCHLSRIFLAEHGLLYCGRVTLDTVISIGFLH